MLTPQLLLRVMVVGRQVKYNHGKITLKMEPDFTACEEMLSYFIEK